MRNLANIYYLTSQVCETIYTLLFLIGTLDPNDCLAQSLTTNLPIVVINSDQEIQDEPKVGASMKIIFNGDGQINNPIVISTIPAA